MKSALVTVSGNSMNSLLSPGDIVLLNKNDDKLRSGDVFVYNSNGNIIIHRVLFVGKKYIWESGDNNYRIVRVAKKKVVAKVVANVTKNIYLNYSRINRQIAFLNLLRCLIGRDVTSAKKLISNKAKCKIIIKITKKRNELQLQYKEFGYGG